MKKGLVPQARPYVDQTLLKASDFTIAKDIFSSSNNTLAMQYFFDNYLQPETEIDPILEEDCQHLESIQQKGFLTRIFFRQLYLLGIKMYPSTPDELIKKETRDFMNFLLRIANKQRGVDVPGGLTFAGSKIRLSVMLVARQETLDNRGIDAFTRRINICKDRGIEHIIIWGTGTDNINLAEHIAVQEDIGNNLRVIDTQKFRYSTDGKAHNAICILCALKSTRSSSEKISIIYDLLDEYIEEFVRGDIVIVNVARNPGVKTKVLVTANTPGIDPISICTEPNKLLAIRNALSGEQIEFVSWTPELPNLVISSLSPLQHNQVLDCKIDESIRSITIIVKNQDAKRTAAGLSNHNINLASSLIGYDIKIDINNQ